MKWFVKCINNYVNFSGRARRAEYWYFILFVAIFSIAAQVIDMILFDGPISSVVSGLFSLFVLLPGLAVAVRRLHDTGRSGKLLLWYLIAACVWFFVLLLMGLSALMSIAEGDFSMVSTQLIVFFFGGLLGLFVWEIFLLVWCCTPGTVGDNQYGPDPKAIKE